LCQLAKQHRHQLSPTAESSRVPLGVVLFYRRFKLVARYQMENLAEDAA
jgi:hypothetical protein